MAGLITAYDASDSVSLLKVALHFPVQLHTEKKGTVQEVPVEPGQSVEAGGPLVILH